MVKRFLAKKANKALFFNLLVGSVSFAVLSVPALAQAGTFSFITSLFDSTATLTNAASSASNSQTMPLLAAAVNLDPQAAIGGGDITVVDGSALLPDQGPSGTAADILNQPANSQISVYTVRQGDTLSEIAQMFDVSINTIVWANDIQKGVITPGQTLIILPISGIQHTVVKSDTLASLAAAYKSDAHDIASYNGLVDGAALNVGDTIIIPDGEVSSVASSVSNSSSSGAVKKTSTSGGSHAAQIKSIAKGSTTEPYLGGSGPALSGYFVWPLNGGVITQGLHGWNAVDIGAPRGTAIYAAAAGTVIVARTGGWNGGYGNYVVISHPNGTETLYAHMSKVITSAGEQVAQGDTIGLVGMTGLATGNHLHFEVRGAENPFASY
ncbi:MAG TPA: M23 family metallopeptidase [Candidatus Paceibacterota bacterium]